MSRSALKKAEAGSVTRQEEIPVLASEQSVVAKRPMTARRPSNLPKNDIKEAKKVTEEQKMMVKLERNLEDI